VSTPERSPIGIASLPAKQIAKALDIFGDLPVITEAVPDRAAFYVVSVARFNQLLDAEARAKILAPARKLLT